MTQTPMLREEERARAFSLSIYMPPKLGELRKPPRGVASSPHARGRGRGADPRLTTAPRPRAAVQELVSWELR
jgi:hypothetical protein